MRIIYLFIVCFLVFSCSENENLETEIESINILEKNQIIDASLDKQIKYKKHHMRIISKWFANYGINQFNSEKNNKDEFFVTELVNNAIHQKNYSVEEETYENLIISLDAFTQLGNESWFPIVRKLENNILNKNANNQTIISIEDADLNGERFTHYLHLPGENDNDLVEVDFEVTPMSAQGYNMYVLELAPLDPMEFLEDDDGGNAYGGYTGGNWIGGNYYGGGYSGGYSGGYTKLMLEHMKIKDLKEGWPGRSEIAFKGYKINVQPNIGYLCGDDIYASVNCGNLDGKRITRLKRRHRNDNKTYNWDIERNETFSNDVLAYVIFEQDSWPAPEKISSMPLPLNAIVNIPFRSWNSDYDERVLTKNNSYNISSPSSFTVNNSTIEYNLRSFGF